MKRMILSALATALLWFGSAGALQAQVWVRAPFVRVGVGPGVYVRAPFVNLYVPTGDRYYYGGYGVPYGPVPYYVPADPRFAPPIEGPPMYVAPVPKTIERPPALPPKKTLPKPTVEEPPPRTEAGTLTVDEFVKGFKPRGGSFEIDLLNPVTKKPTTVRFTLPDGLPKSVEYRGTTVEFRYGPMSFVRIDFDKDGAIVTSR